MVAPTLPHRRGRSSAVRKMIGVCVVLALTAAAFFLDPRVDLAGTKGWPVTKRNISIEIDTTDGDMRPHRLKPTRVHLAGREVVFQSPEGSCASEVKGVLFLYHGCKRRVMSFFYSPQGRDMMLAALKAGLAVVAFEKHHDLECWSPSADSSPVLEAARAWIREHLIPACGESHAKTLPFFGFGVSSGGSFVAEIASETESSGANSSGFKFSGINVQIMTPRAELSTATIFTVMSRDSKTQRGVSIVAKTLKSNRVPTRTIKTKPKMVTQEYFMNRFSEDMSKGVASTICSDLRRMGAISEDGKLVKNPRSIDLDPIFKKVKPARPYGVGEDLWSILRPDEREDAKTLWLIEELNVCYDQHEITAEEFPQVVSFFFEHSE